MLTLEVNRQFVDNQTPEGEEIFKGVTPLLAPTEIQSAQLGKFIVDLLDGIEVTKNKTGLVNDFCENCGQLVAQMLDLNQRIDPNHLDGLSECNLAISQAGIATGQSMMFASLVREAKKAIQCPSNGSQVRQDYLEQQEGDLLLESEDDSANSRREVKLTPTEKLALIYGTVPFAAKAA